MKNRFTKLTAVLALLAFLAVPLGMRGQTRTEVTWTASEQGYSNGASLDGVSIELDDYITIQFDKNDGNNPPAYYNTGTAARLYSKNSLTVTPASGYQITGMTLTFSGTGYTGTLGASVGAYSLSSTTGTWSGSSTSAIVLTNNASSGNARLQELTVTYSDSGTPVPTTYTVTYDCNGGTSGCPENVTGIEGGTTINLADAPTKDGFDFDGWSNGNTSYDAGDEYTVDGNVTFTAQWVEQSSGDVQWILTNLVDLTESDVFVIVGNNGSNYAMANDKGTGSAPTAVAVTVENEAITGTVAANIQWNISGDATNGYTFYPNGTTESWLYCTNTNNGVRVGTNNDKTFKVDGNSGYLKHVVTSRYVGIYNSQDWRCYTSTGGNIADQTFAFYKKVTGGVLPPSIIANDVEIDYNDESGSIVYTINNEPNPAGTLTAAIVEGGTIANLTLGTIENNTVPFTCTDNMYSVPPRTATVTLTYTYGDNQTVTKNVTITQAGDPYAVNDISDITEVDHVYAVIGTVVATNSKGFIIGDGTGYVYTYLNDAPTQSVGEMVKISGTTGTYGHVLQFTSLATIIETTVSNYNGDPAYTVITGVPNYTEGYHLSDYFQFEGTLTKTGNYYLVAVGEAQIRISYPTDEQAADLETLLNKTVRIHGFFTGYSGTGNNAIFTAMMESVEEVVSTEPSITVEDISTGSDGEPNSVTEFAFSNFEVTSSSEFGIQFYNDQGGQIDCPSWVTLSLGGVGEISENEYYCYLYYSIEENEGTSSRTTYFKIYYGTVYSNLATITQDGAFHVALTPNIINVDASVHSGTFETTFVNMENPVVTEWYLSFYETLDDVGVNEIYDWDEWVTCTVNANNQIVYQIEANETNEARTVYFRARCLVNGYYVNSDVVTFTQAAPEAPHYTWDLSIASYDEGASADLVTWSSDFATMTNAKGSSSTGANNYLGNGDTQTHTRFYKNQVLTITPESGYAVNSIVINAMSGYVAGFTGNEWTNAATSTEGSVVTVTPTDINEPVSVVFSAACRATGITVYYETSTAVYYDIELLEVENGTIATDKTRAQEGQTVTLTATPATNYYVSDWTILDGDAEEVEWTDQGTDKTEVTFTMPASDVTVEAVFATNLVYYDIIIDNEIEHGTITANATQALEGTTITLTVTPDAGYILDEESLIVLGDPDEVEVTKMNVTTYTFEMPASDVLVSAEFTEVQTTTYTLAMSIESGRHYIIVAMNGDDAYAMGRQNSNNRAAVSITVVDGVAQVSSNEVHEFVINSVGFTDEVDPYSGQKSGGSMASYPGYWQYTIYDPADLGYLYAASSSSNYLRTETHLDAKDNGVWSIEIYDENVAHIVAFGDNTRKVMRFNSSGNGLFSCYGTDNNMKDIYLYVKDEDVPQYDFYKDITGYGTSNGGYCLVATPTTENANPNLVGMITDDGTNPENCAYDLYSFDFTQEQEWRNYRADAFNYLLNGHGYLYANQSNVTLHFQGASCTSETVNLQFGDTNYDWNGWNLIGNPLSDVAWVGTDNFYVMNVDGTELELAGRSYVNPMEGIFVKAIAANQSIYFTNDYWYYNELGEKLNLRVSGNNGSGDLARVHFGEGQDLEKFMLNPNHTKLYFSQSNKDYAVVSSANEGEMPVNFKAENNGSYTITVDAENMEMNYLHLIDNMTGADVDLLVNPSYSFDAKKTDYASRFRLVFSANNSNIESGNETFAFFNGSEWCISNQGEATLQVIDMMGRIVSSQTINGNAEFNVNETAGVYMLRLVNGENVKVQKVVVR